MANEVNSPTRKKSAKNTQTRKVIHKIHIVSEIAHELRTQPKSNQHEHLPYHLANSSLSGLFTLAAPLAAVFWTALAAFLTGAATAAAFFFPKRATTCPAAGRMALLTEGEVADERLCPRNSARAAAMAAILAHNLCEMQCSWDARDLR